MPGVRRLAVVASLALAWLPASARAYERTTVDGVPNRPLFWADRAIDVELASGSLPGVAPADFRAALDLSLSTWTRAGGCTDIVLRDAGEALSTTTNLDGGAYDGRDRIVARAGSWPAIAGAETLALTTVMYARDTGAILDADTDLNAVAYTFSASTVAPPDRDDVQNTLTHELGHLLGFAHSPVADATMFASAPVGDTSKRDLATDDVRAICETYPTGAPTSTAWPPPRAASGCRASAGRAPDHGALALALLTLVATRARGAARARRAARAAGTACAASPR
jgi:hypothetical protein